MNTYILLYIYDESDEIGELCARRYRARSEKDAIKRFRKVKSLDHSVIRVVDVDHAENLIQWISNTAK